MSDNFHNPCGCSAKTVAKGTKFEGYIMRYCDFHNPYKNVLARPESKEEK